jgi:Protein of unknown function (DUF1552)
MKFDGPQSSPLKPAATPTRRTVLRGTGGVAIGLPFFQSLLPRNVQAATGPKRFAALRTGHGGLTHQNMVPAFSFANESATFGHNIKNGALAAAAKKVGTDTALSPVLTGASNVLTDRLIGKMNVLLGFDIPLYLGHSRGNTLGHNGESDQGPKDLRPMATIDQLMAWSPKFYPNTTGVTQRSITPFDRVSFGWSNPQAGSGTVQTVSTTNNTLQLFDSLFAGVKPPTPGTPPPVKRPSVVDRILESYKSLRASNRRLSMEDRRRLDEHIVKLNELDRRIRDSSAPPPAMCTATRPASGGSPSAGGGNVAQQTKDYGLLNDVIAMAFACGVSRIATMQNDGGFNSYSGSWHQEVAHQHTSAGPQALLAAANRACFQATILDLAAKLDAFEDSPGVTVLDNTLLQWSQESGNMTHDNYAMTVVTFGSAGGYFKTGRFVDYRSGKVNQYKGEYGILYRHWLANALMAMGIPPADFEFGGQPGYGDARGVVGNNNYLPTVISQASKALPLVTNG